jgi:dienelactone hydrolase
MTISAALFQLVMMIALTGSQVSQPVQDTKPAARARAILQTLIDGKHQKFIAAGDEAVRSKLTPQQAQQIWAALEFRLGKYQSVDPGTVTPVEKYNSVRFVLHFERGTQALRIVLDDQGRMAGFWLDAQQLTVPYDPPAYVDSSAFREEKVTVSAGQFPLPGTLTIPVGGKQHPGLVLVHGSGPHDEDETLGPNKPFRDLAQGLGSRQIVVLRYEKRTKAHPNAKRPDEWTLADETIDDALAAAELLRRRPEVDQRYVYVLGHSQGGLAAPYIAQRDPKLAGIIILAGNARHVLDLLDEQTAYLAGLDGTISPEEQQGLDQLHKAIAAIRAGKLDEVPADFGLPARPLAELDKLDPAGAAAGLELPILVLQGGRDYQVTRADFEIWQKQLDKHPNATLRLLENLNHLFITGTGKSTPTEYQQPGHVDSSVIDIIAAWIGTRASSP